MSAHALLLAFTFAAHSTALASYFPDGLADMAATADLIVVGEIDRVDGSNDFRLRIAEVLGGDAKECGASNGHVTVKQFQAWSCAKRWTPYAKGQHVVLFLTRENDRDGNTVNRIMSCGGEGEMPIEMDEDARGKDGTRKAKSVRVRGQSSLEMNQDRRAPLGTDVPYSAFTEAITTFRKCHSFGIDEDAFPKLTGGYWNRSVPELKKFTESSSIAKALIKGLEHRSFP